MHIWPKKYAKHAASRIFISVSGLFAAYRRDGAGIYAYRLERVLDAHAFVVAVDVGLEAREGRPESDAALDIVKVNANNLYKDRLRTWELQARIRMNQQKQKKS